MSGGGVDSLARLVRRALEVPDVVDLLTETSRRTVDLLGARVAGVLVRGGDGGLHVAGASTLDPAVLGTFRADTVGLVAGEVPRTGPAVDLRDGGVLHAFPMRAGGTMFGALSVLAGRTLSEPDGRLAELLADLAALIVLQLDVAHDGSAAVARAHRLLDQRALLSQAVGMLARRFSVESDEALRRLRTAADGAGMVPIDLARDVIERRAPLPDGLDGDGSATRS